METEGESAVLSLHITGPDHRRLYLSTTHRGTPLGTGVFFNTQLDALLKRYAGSGERPGGMGDKPDTIG